MYIKQFKTTEHCSYMNNPSRDAEKGKATTTTQQKGKATQHNSPERKIGCLGWDSNHCTIGHCTCTCTMTASIPSNRLHVKCSIPYCNQHEWCIGLSYSRFRLHATRPVDTDRPSIISYYEILKIYISGETTSDIYTASGGYTHVHRAVYSETHTHTCTCTCTTSTSHTYSPSRGASSASSSSSLSLLLMPSPPYKHTWL